MFALSLSKSTYPCFSAIYDCFKQDFIDNRPVFEGKKLALKRHPLSLGKEATFWHLISEGRTEEERFPDMRRCERIQWPKPIIENSRDTVIKCWKNVRRGGKRICLWLEQHDYLLVLAERKGYLLLWTGYLVTRHHQKRKLQKEYEKYLKMNLTGENLEHLQDAISYQKQATSELQENDDINEYIYLIDKAYDEYKDIDIS